MRQYPSKKKHFNALFELWVRYTKVGKKKHKIEQIYFDRTYKFIGIHRRAKVIGYRKKDGNIRPKSWKMFDDDTCFWNSPEDFAVAFQTSKVYRANSLVEEHLPDMSEEDQRKLYEKLKRKFEPQKS